MPIDTSPLTNTHTHTFTANMFVEIKEMHIKSEGNNKENNSKPQTWASFQLRLATGHWPSEQINYSHANTGDNHKPSVATANRSMRWKRPWLMSRNSIAEDESWKYSTRRYSIKQVMANKQKKSKVADGLSMSATRWHLGKGFRIDRSNLSTARKVSVLGTDEIKFKVLSKNL